MGLRTSAIQGGYLLTVMQLAMIYGVFCVGLNFFMGYTGQASFGQNAFVDANRKVVSAPPAMLAMLREGRKPQTA